MLEALKPNDAVAVVAPSGPFERTVFERGLALIAARYRPVFDDGIFSKVRYLAGDDARRAAEFQSAMERSDIRAVFAARGGYGAGRLSPLLSPKAWRPKPIIGFSDITALHALAARSGMPSVHGPVVTQLGRLPAACAERLWTALESPGVLPPLEGTDSLVPGIAEGRLVGGNLAVFASQVGTPFMPSLDGAVVLFEDVGERPYRIDRMWSQLVQSGAFKGVRAFALGEFTDCDEKNTDYGALDVLRSLAQAEGVPTLAGLPLGHGATNMAVPLGRRVRLDADNLRLEFLEALTGP